MCFLGACSWDADGDPPILINELMARNFRTLDDNAEESNDWIELYNASDSAVNIGGLYLTNNLRKPLKWKIPDTVSEVTTIDPRKYLVLWMDKEPDQGPLHIGMKLPGKGGRIALYSRDGRRLLDLVDFPKQRVDVAYGRMPEHPQSWTYFHRATPGRANATADFRKGITGKPKISIAQQFSKSAQAITLSGPAAAQIYYTLDGSIPVVHDSLRYQGPFVLDSTAVIRAIACKKDDLESNVLTRTCFIGEQTHLPVISLGIDPEDLWHEDYGIFRHPDYLMEKVAHLEFFEAGRDLGFRMNVGIKVGGGVSKKFRKCPFNIIPRGVYGHKKINYKVFPDKKIQSFGGLFLRSDPTSGRPGEMYIAGERIKNELIYALNRRMGSELDIQVYRPAVLYLNGKYWGLYNIMERKGLDFVRSHHGINKIDMINGEGMRVVEGSRKNYDSLISMLNNADVSDPAAYRMFEKRIDIPNLIDYWILEIYMNTHDHFRNIRWWRPRNPGGKWRWIAYDFDSWADNSDPRIFSLTCDTLAHDYNILARMLQFTAFEEAFVRRMSDYLNTGFQPKYIHQTIDSILKVMGPEKNRDYTHWKGKMAMVEPGEQVEWLKNYTLNRATELRNEMPFRFSLTKHHPLSLEVYPRFSGSIQLNTIKLSDFPWTGHYFEDYTQKLEAIPESGYVFSHWEGSSHINENPINYYVTQGDSLKAVFRQR